MMLKRIRKRKRRKSGDTMVETTVNRYAIKIKNTLLEHSYDEAKASQIVQSILTPYTEVDPIAKIKGYKSLKKIYLPDVQTEDMFYLSLDPYTSALAVRRSNDEYSVAFSFFNSKDDFKLLAKGNQWKKYPLVNFIKNKFTYYVKATSPINAICLAFNKNKKDFPNKRSKDKATPFVSYIWPSMDDTPVFETQETPPYLVNAGIEYFKCKEWLKSTTKLTDVRYYITEYPTNGDDPGVSALVVKNGNTFTVTFAFLSMYDKSYISDTVDTTKWCQTDFINASKIALINNKKNSKYTYTVTDTKNSISSVVKAFNKNRRDFPSRYRKFKVKLDAAIANPLPSPL